MGKLFHTVGAAMENDLAPKVACMHPLGRSKTIEQRNRNEYAEGDLMLGEMPCMALKVIIKFLLKFIKILK